jgi:hypothetical protein
LGKNEENSADHQWLYRVKNFKKDNLGKEDKGIESDLYSYTEPMNGSLVQAQP